MARITQIVIFLICAAILSACGAGAPSAPAAETRLVTDGIGRKVELPAEVTRAVSLAPNLTEIVFAVGGGEKLVGVTTFCNYPAEAKQIPKVGDTLKPNVETIVALRPQVVFVSTASQLEVFTGLLERQGIAVYVTNPDSLESVFGSMLAIGDVLGKKQEAEEVVGRLRARVEKVREKAARFTYEVPQTVFVQIDPNLYTVGRGSFITDLIATAGGRSVTAEIETAYPKVSKEAASGYNPRIIILSDSLDNREPNEVFADSQAVRNGRVFRVDADVLSRPGPRIVQALEQIADAIHGQKPAE
ncbi:MAG: ABC transporter substrate-binding protein [Acidobacteriota bacterium]|nr:MAG: ABC transporter substrate-binding protein [Acidobacteriota bacterium]